LRDSRRTLDRITVEVIDAVRDALVIVTAYAYRAR
jgi:hypothetical protein